MPFIVNINHKLAVLKNILLLCLTALLILPNFIKKDINHPSNVAPVYDGKELFDPRLSFINSLDALERYSDSLANASGIETGDTAYLLLLEAILKRRFYHGYSHHPINQNWLAAVGEYVLGHGLSCTVYANDILKYPYAACSQQAIVMTGLLKRKGISYRAVLFVHHYALEAMHNNEWYLFDPNMEPQMSFQQRLHHRWATNTDYLKSLYPERHAAHIDYVFGKGTTAYWGKPNEKLAPNAKIFQSVTGFLSCWAWVLPLVLLLVRLGKRGR